MNSTKNSGYFAKLGELFLSVASYKHLRNFFYIQLHQANDFFRPKNVRIAQSFNWQMKVGGSSSSLASLDNTKFLNILTKSRSVLKDMHPSSCELGLGHHDLASHFMLVQHQSV